MSEPSKLFIQAAKRGNAILVCALAAVDPSLVNLTDEEGATPLHYAAWKGNADVCRALLELGADVNACSANLHYGGTPLHAAAHGNQKEVAAILLESGADITVVSCNGRTPLEETLIHKATAVARLLKPMM